MIIFIILCIIIFIHITYILRNYIKKPCLIQKDEFKNRPILIEINTNSFSLTKDFMKANIDVTVKINTNKSKIDSQTKNILTNLLEKSICEVVKEVDLKTLCNNKKKFCNEVLNSVQEKINEFDMKILSFNLQSIQNEKGLLL